MYVRVIAEKFPRGIFEGTKRFKEEILLRSPEGRSPVTVFSTIPWYVFPSFLKKETQTLSTLKKLGGS